ncbi:MAG: mycothione reductase [Candidatus Marinamargulisbacteria bacterium]|jgi:mycothione reductase
MKSYDVIVIGSGGGSKITRPAANLGLKVAIIEDGHLGGTCLNHGCIPSKMLIHAADVAQIIAESEKFELSPASVPRVRFADLVNRVTKTITADSESIGPVYAEHPNIDLYRGRAAFSGDKTVVVGNTELTADKIFVVAGSRPRVPEIEGLDKTPYLTYKEALRLTMQPKKMIIIGGGFIAVELGHFFGALGTEVVFVCRSQLLRGYDADLQEGISTALKRKYKIHEGSSTDSVAYASDQFSVVLTGKNGKETVSADQLLVAVGTVPNSDRLQIHETSIQCDASGYIKVDKFLETSVPGVWAFGDILGRYQFRHTANYEGEYAFKSVLGDGPKKPLVYPPIPSAVFSNPQIGTVGQSEIDLKASGTPYVIGKNQYKDSAMGMALLPDQGFVKVLYDAGSRKLVGGQVLGEEAATMVHVLIAYLKMGATVDDMADTIYIHPALPENIRNAVRKALEAFDSL